MQERCWHSAGKSENNTTCRDGRGWPRYLGCGIIGQTYRGDSPVKKEANAMLEGFILAAFCGGLTLCVVLGQSILYALAGGLVLFLLYGKGRGFSWGTLLRAALSGVKAVRNILIIFLLIGMLTALWRACGTIPAIVCAAAALIQPGVFYLLSFLLNCGVSVLTGTSFGTAATMGVVCMTMAGTMGLSPALVGGAILAGAFFGDRCSPVSTSALLICQLTETSVFDNIKRMCATAALPFLLSCGIYALLGRGIRNAAPPLDVEAIFSQEFSTHWLTLLPAAAILLLAVLRVDVKWTMLVSIVLAAVCCLGLQGVTLPQLFPLLLLGYHSGDPGVAAMLDGGGILSMVRCAAIVCISSTYAGIFQQTGLLAGAKGAVERLSTAATPFAAILCTAGAASVVACNQTLAIMLTHQLCGELVPDRSRLALDLEDSAVVLAPLVPWSLAGAVPLASIAAPDRSILAACFLYLLPLIRLGGSLLGRRRVGAAAP